MKCLVKKYMSLNWIDDIKKRTKGVPVSSGRSNKAGRISFDDLVFVPAQLSRRPVDYYREEIKSLTILGAKSKKPLKLDVPIIIGAMSFGALSKEAKIALAIGSSQAGSIANTGEGGMLKEEREVADKLILQFSTGRFGISEEILKKADAVEIKIGQGAKPGSGGLLLKDKITKEIAEIRGVTGEEDVHSPAYHKDIKDEKDLKRTVDYLRDITDGVPIIIKLGPGNIEKDIQLAVSANPDVIALDGMEGGTGAAPEVMLDEIGIPTIPSLVRARKMLDYLKAEQELWIGGGFNKGGDIAKALALGANGVFMSFPFLIAMGCIYCKMCYQGKCPQGVATQDHELRLKLDINESSKKIASFIKNCNEEIKMISGAVGKNDIHQLLSEDLRSLTIEMSQMTETKFVSEK